MAVNLGARLRDAVDVPDVDDVLGEDPAAFDLPALSARIRRRRRARSALTSAAGVAAAGAVAVAGVHGLGGRGVETAPPAIAPATADAADVCGTDAAALPAAGGDLWLVSPTTGVVPVASGGIVVEPGEGGAADSLGVLSGRTLVTTLAQGGTAAVPAHAVVALSQGGDVVATGEVTPATTVVVGGGGAVPTQAGSRGSARITEITADLVGCGDPGVPLPSGSYDVQLVVPEADGLHRAATGPWHVRLLNPSVPAPFGSQFPSDEVPVVGGNASAQPSDGLAGPVEWIVFVRTSSVDAVPFAADALRAAGALVTMGEPVVTNQLVTGPGEPAGGADDMADLQRALDEAEAAHTAAQAALAEITNDLGRLQELAAAADEVAQSQTAVLDATTALVQAEQQRQATSLTSYRFGWPTTFTATTAHWTVAVSFEPEVLTYRLTPR